MTATVILLKTKLMSLPHRKPSSFALTRKVSLNLPNSQCILHGLVFGSLPYKFQHTGLYAIF